MKKLASETRQHILDTAKILIVEKGYTGAGLTDLLEAARVPKGSFYYYFKSKEDFGCQLLEAYFDEYFTTIDSFLEGKGRASKRLLAYFSHWMETQATTMHDKKCLVVKLGAEVCDQSEAMRAVLDRGTKRIVEKIAACIDQGRADGSITTTESPHKLASSLYQLWLGASLMAKLTRGLDAYLNALKTTTLLLK